MFFVYCVTGPTGVYVGKARDVSARWYRHKHHAQGGSSKPLYRAIRKHGIENFTLEIVLQSRDERDSYECERLIIAQERRLGTRLYNLSDGGRGSFGCSRPKTAEHRRKIGESNKKRPASTYVRGDAHYTRREPAKVRKGEEVQHLVKMTEGAVRELRELRANGTSLNALAQKYSISTTTVWNIARRATWNTYSDS